MKVPDGQPACGWLIKGDPARPCVRKPGHKNRHRDAAWREEMRERCRRWNARNLLRKYQLDQEAQERARRARLEALTNGE